MSLISHSFEVTIVGGLSGSSNEIGSVISECLIVRIANSKCSGGLYKMRVEESTAACVVGEVPWTYFAREVQFIDGLARGWVVVWTAVCC